MTPCERLDAGAPQIAGEALALQAATGLNATVAASALAAE
jgi:hypothetical protein